MEPTRRAGGRLQELLDKQDIHEVLSCDCRGLDRGDADIVASACPIPTRCTITSAPSSR